MRIPIPRSAPAGSGEAIVVRGAREHNLKDIDVRFPLGGIRRDGRQRQRQEHAGQPDPLRALAPPPLRRAREARRAREDPGRRRDRQGHRDRPVAHRPTPRSNPGHLHGRLRPDPPALRQDPRGKDPRLQAGPLQLQRQGRALRGLPGPGPADRDALPAGRLRDVRVCRAPATTARRSRSTYRGKTIADVLAMRWRSPSSFFENVPRFANSCSGPLARWASATSSWGRSTTLSGGEAQRVKLAAGAGAGPRTHALRARRADDRAALRRHHKLLDVLCFLPERGNSVITIKHNLDVIRLWTG